MGIAAHVRSMCRWTHSGFMPEVLMTLAHLSVSAAMNLSNAAGVIGIGSTPRSVSLACSFGSASATFMASLSLLTISPGVPFGVPSPKR